MKTMTHRRGTSDGGFVQRYIETWGAQPLSVFCVKNAEADKELSQLPVEDKHSDAA